MLCKRALLQSSQLVSSIVVLAKDRLVSAESCSLHIAGGCLIQVHKLRGGHHAAGSRYAACIDSMKGRAWYAGTGARFLLLRHCCSCSSSSARSCCISRTKTAIVTNHIGTYDCTAAELCWTKCCMHMRMKDILHSTCSLPLASHYAHVSAIFQ